MRAIRSCAGKTLILFCFLIANRSVGVAGPPLLCHAIDIGGAESLPWGRDNWDNAPIKLDDNAFVDRTLALLSPTAAVFIRMETIRRATIHASGHPRAASALLDALEARWSEAESSKEPNGPAYFDYGYLLAAYAQMNLVTAHESRGSTGADRKKLVEAASPDPYSLVSKALELDDEKGSIEFALAVMTTYPRNPNHERHLKNALGCAGENSLLALNLVKHFGGERGRTVEELRKSYWSQTDGERH